MAKKTNSKTQKYKKINEVAYIKLYVPIENLEVDEKITLGSIIIHPSSDIKGVIDHFNEITKTTKNTEEEKKKISKWQENDLKQHLGRFAFTELEWVCDPKEKLIPKDLTTIYDRVKEVLAVLYLLQKQITGITSVEHQKFGLSRELYRSLNCIVATEKIGGRSSYSLQREGVLADWKFVKREIDKFPTNSVFQYFNSLLNKKNKNEMESRLLSSIIWLYDAILDFTPTGRFIKLIISLEVLFASKKNQKSFRLSRFSTLLSHLYIFQKLKCQCPILESHTYNEYKQKIEELGLPGVCSAFWDIRKWYKIRSGIVHDADRHIEKKDLNSLEWWAHKLIFALIEVLSRENISTLDELENFLEQEYQEKLNSN